MRIRVQGLGLRVQGVPWGFRQDSFNGVSARACAACVQQAEAAFLSGGFQDGTLFRLSRSIQTGNPGILVSFLGRPSYDLSFFSCLLSSVAFRSISFVEESGSINMELASRPADAEGTGNPYRIPRFQLQISLKGLGFRDHSCRQGNSKTTATLTSCYF